MQHKNSARLNSATSNSATLKATTLASGASWIKKELFWQLKVFAVVMFFFTTAHQSENKLEIAT